LIGQIFHIVDKLAGAGYFVRNQHLYVVQAGMVGSAFGRESGPRLAHHHLWDAPRQRYLVTDLMDDVAGGQLKNVGVRIIIYNS
jgi:hypothetical protein